MLNVECQQTVLTFNIRHWPSAALLALAVPLVACKGSTPPVALAPAASVQNVLIVTIDTLRADRVGAFGYTSARTPVLDGLARDGTKFDRAYATAPITLTSHASLMTGRYPPGHGARHNGIRIDPKTPTLADRFAQEGFATAAFVAAFPLDRRFGLIKGFQTYGDRMPRGADGRPANERPGHAVVDEAIEWLGRHRQTRFFLWVHLFEPHAPYGDPSDAAEAARPLPVRYDDEVAEADRQVGRLLDALWDARAKTLIVVAGDHGEAFGEHGEISHSVFTYDTTLRVPLIIQMPEARGAGVAVEPVSLVDVAPTVTAAAHVKGIDPDGVDLSPALRGGTLPPRALYAESFAPLFDFGWSPLRTVRQGRFKYIAAPRPELYDLQSDPGETHNIAASDPRDAADLATRVDAISSAALPLGSDARDPETLARLQALGYVSGGREDAHARPDPKDRRELAARVAEVASGELQGAALERALRDILRQDPGNPQACVRLGYVLVAQDRCADAIPLFTRAIQHHFPTADAHLGLAGCQVAARNTAGAARTLQQAEQVEPDNPVVQGNLGIVLSDGGHPADALPYFERALTLDPDLHQARFSLAVAYARLGRRPEAAREATELLRRLPANAPQRPEVQRLLAAVS